MKCPYPQGSLAFRIAKAKLDNAIYADTDGLRAEFEMYKDGSTPVTHYNLCDEWFTSVGSVKTEQVNMKGIQRHGAKFRVQKSINGQLQRWTFDTLDMVVRKRDAIFAEMATE